MYDSIVVGCGFAGATVARELAEKKGQQVLVIDSREHIGGNCYDCVDDHGILIQPYGPHIFHTNDKGVYDFVSRFTEWNHYEHCVVANVNGKELPVPFNFHSLEMVYGPRASMLEKKLTEAFGEGARVSVLDLMKHDDDDVGEIGQYVYEHIFLHYTKKQWGQTPEELDASVAGRVPVLLSRDDRYFQDTYQGLPLRGYTPLFEKMLAHERITVRLQCAAKEVLKIEPGADTPILFEGKPFGGNVIYTGALDELFGCCYGRLPYRSLRFAWEHYDRQQYQSHGVVNYTVSEEYTRITEFKHLTGQEEKRGTTIVKEYPVSYEPEEGAIPYYTIGNEKNMALYEKYRTLAAQVPNLRLLGRLAEYRYYNMDECIARAIHFSKK